MKDMKKKKALVALDMMVAALTIAAGIINFAGSGDWKWICGDCGLPVSADLDGAGRTEAEGRYSRNVAGAVSERGGHGSVSDVAG